jgi:hypothetical protein
MVKGQASIVIEQPLPQVYDFIVVDFARNYRRWSPEVQRLEMLTGGPLRKGSRARQVRVDQGRRSDTTFQVSNLEPQHRVCFVESTRLYQGDYSMQSLGEKTRLNFVFTLQRLEFYMRPFEKLIRVAIQEGADRTVRNIKALVETDAARSNECSD